MSKDPDRHVHKSFRVHGDALIALLSRARRELPDTDGQCIDRLEKLIGRMVECDYTWYCRQRRADGKPWPKEDEVEIREVDEPEDACGIEVKG